MKGRQGAPFEMRLELGKVREFSTAVGLTHPDAIMGSNPVAAPTFLTTARFWSSPESDPWHGVPRDYASILHGEQEFIFNGPPPRVGDLLEGQTTIADVYEKTGRRGGTMTFTVTVTEFRDVHGRVVAQSRGTTIVTERPTEEADR